ncbi:DUF2141 domain-containing protein [Catenovulum agarivorans]|uniref:DUF2141 domain-containing protein n=1 Tax=Catenovulum agarivorans TaxID=1172192 RepID=UPI0013644F79|nr:DUF2141 domain-containing protein [Catenovulum agarivorans]
MADSKLPLGFNITITDDFKYEKNFVIHTQIYQLPEQTTEVNWADILEVTSHHQPYKSDSNLVELKLPANQYCARFFIDTNDNQKLDVSSIGLPVEPVGFANNPILTFGEPAPSEACFALDSALQLDIRLRAKKSKRRFKP